MLANFFKHTAGVEPVLDPVFENVPRVPTDMRFTDLVLMSEGTHAFLYRGEGSQGDLVSAYCVKIFRHGWMTPFNLELNAYETLLDDPAMKNYIPQIYGWGERTLSEWGLPNNENNQDIYYGLVVEWVENAEWVSTGNITVRNAMNLIAGLSRMHELGVSHNDEFPQNMLVVPKLQRALWIDLSCARFNEPETHPGTWRP